MRLHQGCHEAAQRGLALRCSFREDSRSVGPTSDAESRHRAKGLSSSRIGGAMRSAGLILAFGVLTCVLSLTPGEAVAAAQGTPQLLTNVRAADVLADLITYTVGRADARVENIKQYLRETGSEAAFEKARQGARNPLVPYSELLKGAVVFVSGDGARFADPSLDTLNDAQLSDELANLQVYNIQQFQKLNDQVK